MKYHSLPFAILTIALLSSISLHAQSSSTRHLGATSIARGLGNGDGPVHYAGPGTWSKGEPIQPLSELVSIQGADSIPVWGHLQQQQSDGRAMHNIQVDPSDPNKVHAVIMEETSLDPLDTNLFFRRLLYTFSSDGGHNWTKPDTLGNTRDGFACMILYQRGGQYVPIIAAHRYLTNSATSAIESAIWIEQSAPGTGNFAMTECGTAGVDGTANLLWPYIGISPDNSTIYIVSSYSGPTATSVNYFQFGTFMLTAAGKATFNGWAQDIGDNDYDPSAGYCETGDYVLRVSPKGKVGLLWREADYTTPNTSLFFIESTDGGTTWPQNFTPIDSIVDQGAADPNSNEIYSGPWTYMDFFYAGENAKILWSADNQSFPSSGNSYYPTEISLHMYDAATQIDREFVSNRDPDISPDSAQYSLLGTLSSFNNTLDSEADALIAYPTIAQSSDPNTFTVFYETFPMADTVLVTATGAKLYGSIYYQMTKDGGVTWTAPAPFRTNNGPAGAYGKIDFRWPQVSDWNGASIATYSPTVMYGADTAAGTEAKAGDPDWDEVDFFHDTLALNESGVSTNPAIASAINLQNYPNPFAGSTTIDFTLPDESNVLLTVTDMLGRSVQTLVNGRLGAGSHSVVFNAGDLANGVYRYTLQADGASVSKSISLLR